MVVAIIGILSTAGIIAFGMTRQKSRDAKRLADIKQIQNSLGLYYADKNQYPPQGIGGYVLGSDVLCLDSAGFSSECFSNIYMKSVPSNPLPKGQGYLYNSYAADGSQCSNGLNQLCINYSIIFALEGKTQELGDPGIFIANQNGIKAQQ